MARIQTCLQEYGPFWKRSASVSCVCRLQNSGIVGSTTGSNYYVRILSTLNRELLKPSSSVALHRHSNALVDMLPPEADSSISLLSQSERPDVTYQVSVSSSWSHYVEDTGEGSSINAVASS